MSDRTTGRRMLADLERRVSALEGNSKADPVEKVRQALSNIDQRLKALEADKPNPPENNQSVVENG